MVRIIFTVVLSVCFAHYASALDKKCTHDEAFQAESDTDNLKDWDSVYQSFKRFGHCDTGAISEGYSDAVGRLLADNWKQFNKFHILCSKDEEFERFALKHIDMTVSINVLKEIVKNSHLHCPSDSKDLCKKIETASDALIAPYMK